MSTRCQVQVIQEGLTTLNGEPWEDKLTIYHHWDGYPSNMIPLIKAGYKLGKTTDNKDNFDDWKLGRTGHAAAFIISADPGGYEPEEGHQLHGDIEYLYRVYLANKRNGSMADKPTWDIEVLTPKAGFWDKAELDNMSVLVKRIPLSKANGKKIEEQEASDNE